MYIFFARHEMISYGTNSRRWLLVFVEGESRGVRSGRVQGVAENVGLQVWEDTGWVDAWNVKKKTFWDEVRRKTLKEGAITWNRATRSLL